MEAKYRPDTKALLGGILFCFLSCIAIWLFGDRLNTIPFLEDQGYSWYYWKLPERTAWAWWSAWGLYTLHQISHFTLIYIAQTKVKHYAKGLHAINYWALGINALFVLLHFAQTHLWYDGLAQDHPPQYPQYSVILLLVWVLLMENQRRGLIFGWQVPISQQISSFARKYHGYLFSWAIVYTFWYHPMHASPSHLSGFFYTLLLLLQGSLFLTRIHTNRYWTFIQEFLVLIHGTMVAYFQGPDIWPMFLFGFSGIFIVTQMHGIGLSRLLRTLCVGVYAGAIYWVYSVRGIGKINEILRIPVADYILVGLLACLIGGGLLSFNLLTGRARLRKP